MFSKKVNENNFGPESINIKTYAKLNKSFTQIEINNTVTNFKNNSAPGIFGFPYEYIKLLWEIAPSRITKILNNLWKNETIPQEWTKGIITLLHKKADKKDLNNYRNITLLTTMWKFLMLILNSRLTKFLETKIFYLP